MKRIIEIDDKDYDLAYDIVNGINPKTTRDRIYKAIAQSTPYKPSGGLTEAEKIICKVYLEDLDKRHTCNEYKLLMSLIDNATTTDERPQGEWLFKHNSSDIWCSVCDENFDEIPQAFNFCPNCGADMRGGAE